MDTSLNKWGGQLLALVMKHRNKLWIAFALMLAAGLLSRFAWRHIYDTLGVVLIILSAGCIVAASTVFAIYFKER